MLRCEGALYFTSLPSSSLLIIMVLQELAQSSTSIGSILRSKSSMAPIDNTSAFGISQLSSITRVGGY